MKNLTKFKKNKLAHTISDGEIESSTRKEVGGTSKNNIFSEHSEKGKMEVMDSNSSEFRKIRPSNFNGESEEEVESWFLNIKR